MKRLCKRIVTVLVAVVMMVAAAPISLRAQDTVEALKQRIRELEQEDRALEEENGAMKQKPERSAASQAQSREEPSAPSLQAIAQDDREYQFLKLGQDKDYLRAERWRIINQIEQAIPPLYEPVRPFHGYTLPPGTFRVGLSTTIGRNPGDFGTDKFYSLFFNKVKVDFLTVDLDLFYGFEIGPIHDMTLRLNVPYKFLRHSGTGHPFRIDPMVMTMEGAGNGVGDISLTLKKKWLDQGNYLVTFSTFLGVIFPTAQDDQEFNASQTVFVNGVPMAVSANIPGNPAIDIFGRKPGDRLFPRIAQPGNGSWGARVGFGVTRQFERSALHAGAIFDILADNDGITPGNELKYGLSYVFPPLASDYLTIDLSLFGRWRGDEEFPGTIVHPERDPATGGPIMDANGNVVLFTTKRPDFKHGNVTFVSPSLIFIPVPNARIFISPAFRIVEPDTGPSPQWTVTGGITYTF